MNAARLLPLFAAIALVACPPSWDAPPPPRRHRAHHASPRTPVAPRPPPTAPGPVALGSVQLRVTFIDVGQGDAALLESSDGHVGMIDTGPPEGRAHLREVLEAHHVTALDWLVLSHPHLDHIGNARDVLDHARVAVVRDPAYPHAIATYERLLDRIQTLGVAYRPAHAGDALTLGAQTRLDVLQPHEPFVSGSRSDVNANSVVLRLTVGHVHVLFPGDAERETEQRLLAEDAGSLQADVLKVAHHGSAYASSDAFLTAVAPRWAVISCATGNDYGHPSRSTLDTLSRHGATIRRTDLNGDIVLTTDGASVQLTPAREAEPDTLLTPGIRTGGREPQ